MCINLGRILEDAALKYPQLCAIRTDEKEYTFQQTRTAARCLCAQLLDRGVHSGNRVGLLIPNVPAFSISYFAVLWTGAIVVPVNPVLSNREIVEQLAHAEIQLLIVDERLAHRVDEIENELPGFQTIRVESNPIESWGRGSEDPQTINSGQFDTRHSIVDTDEDATAVILYTSGTTGRPKGVELSHRNLYLNAKSVSEEKFSTPDRRNILGPGEVGLATLPLSHAFGQTNLQNGIWFSGGSIAFQEKFDSAKTIDLLARHQVTFFAGVPTMFVELVRVAKELGQMKKTLKYCVCGGAALSADIKHDFNTLFGVQVQESYGLSETSPMVSCQRIHESQQAGNVGKPIDGVQLKIDKQIGDDVSGEIGEILVRGHNVFKGYFRDNEATGEVFRDGWFCTGDIGYLNDAHDLVIVDRKKEIIKSGGYTVFPREVENVLLDLEWVEQAVVVGVPDTKFGEKVKALIKLIPAALPTNTLESAEQAEESVLAKINSNCKKNLAPYKCPRIVEFVESFPLGSTGKIDRKKLRAVCESKPG